MIAALVDTDRTTAAVQRYLNELAGLQGDSPAEPIVRDLLARAADRLRWLGSALLHRGYPRLAQPPLNFQSDEMLGAVVERLLKAMREVRPGTVRQFFGLASQHMRWELNDLARRLDHRPRVAPLSDNEMAAQDPSDASRLTPKGARILAAIDELPEEEREVFNLVRIQGLMHAEAADLIGISLRTVQRRLNRGLLLLSEALRDLRPESGEVNAQPE